MRMRYAAAGRSVSRGARRGGANGRGGPGRAGTWSDAGSSARSRRHGASARPPETQMQQSPRTCGRRVRRSSSVRAQTADDGAHGRRAGAARTQAVTSQPAPLQDRHPHRQVCRPRRDAHAAHAPASG